MSPVEPIVEAYLIERGVTRCPERKAGAPAARVAAAAEKVPDHWSRAVDGSWCVVSVDCAGEYRVRDRLEAAGWCVWLPECIVVRQHKRFAGMVARFKGPLFPGYLFVRLDLSVAQWRRIEEADGADRLLRSGDCPAAVPAAEMDRLRRLIEADGGAIEIRAGRKRRPYATGETVRVIGGPFAGFKGIYESPEAKDRINILLDILGTARVIAISEAQVEPA